MAHIAYIGLGSNRGDRARMIAEAVAILRAAPGVLVATVSRLHETEPVGGPSNQESYLNAAARIETTLDAPELMRLLLETERVLGRRRRERWGPRTIDLDLLLFDDLAIDTPELTVPHPRMHQRLFVLEPLREIAPEARHPVLSRSVTELLEELRQPDE